MARFGARAPALATAAPRALACARSGSAAHRTDAPHRSASLCHLGVIAIRLGRKLQWDPEKESFVGDADANAWLRRQQRKPYQIEA